MLFSPSEYEFAARILGLPYPESMAEKAIAAPMVSRVLRECFFAAPPMPDGEEEMQYMGATRSLNGYPDNNEPMVKNAIGRRMRAGLDEPQDEMYLEQLLEMVMTDPQMLADFLGYIDMLEENADNHMDMLSAQRPMEYDTPNLGANYSVLNAPSSPGFASPSEEFQQLS